MKIIFLDIDGVLNSERFIVDHHKEYNDPTYMIDQYTVTLLRDMLDKHDDCKLVITSSWRYGNVQKTVDFLKEHSLGRLTDFIVGVTPRSTNGGRGDEIKWFMDNLNTDKIGDFVSQPFEIEEYAILDDDSFDLHDEQIDHLVKTNYVNGLQSHHVKLVEFLLYGKSSLQS